MKNLHVNAKHYQDHQKNASLRLSLSLYSLSTLSASIIEMRAGCLVCQLMGQRETEAGKEDGPKKK